MTCREYESRVAAEIEKAGLGGFMAGFVVGVLAALASYLVFCVH
jgi:hypothetical protein